MPQTQKAVPEKWCAACGKLLTRKRYNGTLESVNIFLRRKYCDLACFGRGIRKEKVTLAGLRKRAVLFRGNVCEECGATTKLAIHHMDSNPANNAPENLRTFCAGCHLRWHWSHGKKAKTSPPCSVCGEKSRRHGMCQMHYARFKRYGDPLLTKRRNGWPFVLVRVSPRDSQRTASTA